MNKILVSIGCATYNHEKFIGECLDGILKQKVDFLYEVIIGEDCSTDKTQKICQGYAKKYSDKIRLICNKKNIGGVNNWQNIINNCVGKYVAFCEGDDYWIDPLKLQKQVDFLESNFDYVVCYQDAKVINRNGIVVNSSYGPKKDFSCDGLMKGPVIPIHSLCFRNVLKDFPIEAQKMFGSHRFTISRLGLYGKGKWLGDSILPGVYRIHSGSSWSSKNKEEKLYIDSNTSFWIYQYYKRIGKKKYAAYWNNEFRRAISKINNNNNNNILSFQINKCFLEVYAFNKLLRIKFKNDHLDNKI